MSRYLCPDCRKLVKDKFIFGLLHICLSPEELAERDRQRREMQWTADEQRRFVKPGARPFQFVGNLADATKKDTP